MLSRVVCLLGMVAQTPHWPLSGCARQAWLQWAARAAASSCHGQPIMVPVLAQVAEGPQGLDGLGQALAEHLHDLGAGCACAPCSHARYPFKIPAVQSQNILPQLLPKARILGRNSCPADVSCAHTQSRCCTLLHQLFCSGDLSYRLAVCNRPQEGRMLKVYRVRLLESW